MTICIYSARIDSLGNFVYAKWRKWDKSVNNFLSTKITLIGITLAYVIRKDDAPVTIIFNDGAYEVDPE